MKPAIPLKFGVDPERTAIRSYHMDSCGATVRYDDEKDIAQGDRLKMTRPDGSLIGYANVLSISRVRVWEAMDIIRQSGAVYSCDYSRELLDTLREHYTKPIGPNNKVKVIVYSVFQIAD